MLLKVIKLYRIDLFEYWFVYKHHLGSSLKYRDLAIQTLGLAFSASLQNCDCSNRRIFDDVTNVTYSFSVRKVNSIIYDRKIQSFNPLHTDNWYDNVCSTIGIIYLIYQHQHTGNMFSLLFHIYIFSVLHI